MNKIKLMKSVMGVVEEVSNLLALTSSLLALLLTLLTATTAEAAHIKETLTLKKGWNGVYLESTPDVAECAKFFKDLQVTKVMAYDGKGLDGMPLIDENGRDVLQPPVYYYTWNAAAPDAGTLKSLVGGRCYLIYATSDCTKDFTGVPHPPHVFWRKTETAESLLNLVGVSCNPDENVSAAAYFGEGPYDGGNVLVIGAKDESKPTLGKLLGASPKVANGTAYSLSASRSGLWPGVISVGSDQLLIANGSGTLKVSNAGTEARKFQMKMVESIDKANEVFPPLQRQLPRTGIEDPGMTNVVAGGSWEVDMPLNGSVELLFKPVSEKMEKGKTYAAVLEILDLGQSKMRVRIPVWVLDEKDESVDGLWVGAMALDKVSSIDGKKQPFPAAGIMSLNVIMHVSSNGTSRLLQRAIVAADPDGGTVACFDNEDFPYPWSVTYRMFTGMMSVDVPSVEETHKKNFSQTNELFFTWGVPERARDNPFRHAWHPDHDGRTADYSAAAPTGDDLSNYGGIIKPELWSVTNTLSFKLDGKYAPNADESVSGTVTWDVGGLVSTNTIRSTGAFTLRRVVKGVEMGK